MKKDKHIIYNIDVTYGTTYTPEYLYNIEKAKPLKLTFKQKFFRLFKCK